MLEKSCIPLISRTTTNACIYYLGNSNITGKKMTHLDFQVSLVEGLIAGYDEPRTSAGRPSLVADEARLTACHFIGYIPENKCRKCEVCTQDKSGGFKGYRIGTWCSDCGVGLCIGDYFRRYHTLQKP